jgi:hypothetical protein
MQEFCCLFICYLFSKLYKKNNFLSFIARKLKKYRYICIEIKEFFVYKQYKFQEY